MSPHSPWSRCASIRAPTSSSGRGRVRTRPTRRGTSGSLATSVPRTRYKLLFSDSLGSDDENPQTRTPFETTWYRDAASFDDATVITVPTSGSADLGTIPVSPHTGALRFIGNPVIQQDQFQDGLLVVSGVAASPGTAKSTAQWYHDGTAISGATSYSYTPVAADEGTVLTVTVTAKLGTETASATSAGYEAPSDE
ncbi:hypothetical protein Q9Q99_04635 [Curtobacterium flaccumfaciens]|nr:hypothetical protein Q9Q99_04635 [Curtobacterium flaccumfaciens]